MTDNESLENFSKINKIEYEINRMREINRLQEIERTYLTIIVMLIGLAISVYLISSGEKTFINSLSLISTFLLVFLLIFFLIPIFTNNLKIRIEFYGKSSIIILLIFGALIGSLLDLFLKLYIPEFAFGIFLLVMGFLMGFYYEDIDKKITLKIYNQFPILENEIKLKDKHINVEHERIVKIWDRTLWIVLIIGLIIPMLLYFIFSEYNKKYADILRPFLLVMAIFVIFILIFGLIDIVSRKS